MAPSASDKKTVVSSTVVHADDAHTPNSGTPPQVLDAKAVKYKMSRNESGMSCSTCLHYHLQVELDEDSEVPPKPQHDYDAEELINMVKLPVYWGFCSRWMPEWGLLLSGIRGDWMCPYFEEKPQRLQFEDDVINEDDGRTPVAPTTIVSI